MLFLDTNAAQILKKLRLLNQSTYMDGRKEVLAFLSKGQRANYVPQSGEITRILKEMDDEMGRDSVEEETLVKKYEERTGAMQSGQRLHFQLQHTKDFFKKIVCVWGNWVP